MKKRLLIHASWPICFIWITLFLNTPCTGQYLDLNCENKDFEEKVIDLSPFCPPIISQGQLNSCTGYGNGYYAMSLMYNKALNITDTLLKSKFAFSANFPYDLIEGKTGAVNPTHVLHNLKTIGNVRYNEYDLLPPSDKMSEKAKSKYLSDASKFKIISYQSILDPENNKKGSVTRSASIDKIKCALLNGFPVTANISQTATFFNLKIKTYTPITNDIFVGEHMITIIGYNNESERFHLVNSYGLNWGENGFAYIGYFDLLDMINYAYIFNINSEKEALQHYETLLAPENNLPGICNEQNTVHLDKNIFLASKPFESAIKMNNISIVASEQYIDGNIITLQRELKDKNKNENIYLKKLSPEGTILASTQILSPLLKKENVLHSAKIKAATDGSITIVFTTFDGANYYTYFTHYDFRLQELRKVTHLMDSQGKEFTPVSNIILEKHIMHFVTHDNYFYLYKYNIRTKEISKSIINYEDLKDPLVSLRVSGLEREVQNLHLNKTLDDQFLVFGTYEVKKQEEQNGFNLIIDRQFEKYLHFAEIKELRFNKLIYIQSVLPINKQEFLLAGNIGCEPFLYLSEISANKEIKVLKKYDLITPVQNYHLALVTDAAFIGHQVIVSMSVMDNPTMTGSIFPLVVKIPLDTKKQGTVEELYQNGYTYIHNIISTQENKLVFVSEKTKLKHPYVNIITNYCDDKNFKTDPNFRYKDLSIWQSSSVLSSTSQTVHAIQSWTVTHPVIPSVELDSVALIPIMLTPTQSANALCNPYLDIICDQKNKIDFLSRMYLPEMTKRLSDTIYVPIKNIALKDNEAVQIQLLLGQGNKNICKDEVQLSGKTRQINLDIKGKISDPKTGDSISHLKDNMAIQLDLNIFNLSNVSFNKLEIELPDLGKAFSNKSEAGFYKLWSGKNLLNKANLSGNEESLQIRLFVDDSNAFKPLKINIYVNDVLHKVESLHF